MAGTGGFAAPNLPTIYTDPSQVATPGMNQEIQNVYTQGGQAQGQANNSALNALQRAGVGGGSESANALGNIAGQTAQGEGSALAGLQNQEFQEESSLMNALNQADIANYSAQSENNIYNNLLRNQLISGTGTGAGSLLSGAANLVSAVG